ncbi:MAG: DUF4358 domain-containing protein [Acetatifactor sp.]|nr:DUF4358 domain-containing protein [Acetatifactor sp.]MDE7269082.1 DUF4358 domain-containing protein [Acetatifactor sp.]
MKKWMLYLCVGALSIGLTACGNKKNDIDTSTDSDMQENSSMQDSTGTDTVPDGDDGDLAGGMEAETGWSEEMATLREAVVNELGEGYWPNTQIPAEMLEMNYGLTSDMYEDYMGESPMISANVDTLLIVKAAEGQADAVEEALQNYRTDLVENSLQYPMNVPKVQGSMVERIDDYVCFVLLGGDLEAAAEHGDEAAVAYSRKQNQRAIDVIKETLNYGV